MNIAGFVNHGFDGDLVHVEVDLRRGIPGVDIVGLPDNAVREARERVRVSIRNSGFDFPRERVLINLAPAGVKKEGASFDLSIAAAVLFTSGQLVSPGAGEIMFLGELELSGRIREVNGVISAVSRGREAGIGLIVVPRQNLKEASTVFNRGVYGIDYLAEIPDLLGCIHSGRAERYKGAVTEASGIESSQQIRELDFSDIRGHKFLKRALEVAAAGGHHVYMFGPPGSGKTMSALRLPGILPDLTRDEAVEVTRIHSISGKLDSRKGLVKRPPVRMPHHTASREGLIGGGRDQLPGEISLAHRGILFLDEAPEFNKTLLQSLREPLERGRVDIARSDIHYWYPARFQLIMTANPCPCGNLGKGNRSCFCSIQEIRKYWKKVGGALMDRIDIRIPVESVKSSILMGEKGETSRSIRERVGKAVEIQRRRFKKTSFSKNVEIPAASLLEYCILSSSGKEAFTRASEKLELSSRACHSVLRVARTIADLEGKDILEKDHIYEAVQHRRYGDGDYFWRR
ncbi:MAG: ATP-binding protein [Spirochaetes bacterium]|nr:MAG: ATP-binding protein [Spirochaetota bacterium]